MTYSQRIKKSVAIARAALESEETAALLAAVGVTAQKTMETRVRRFLVKNLQDIYELATEPVTAQDVLDFYLDSGPGEAPLTSAEREEFLRVAGRILGGE